MACGMKIVAVGDRVAQLILERIAIADVVEVTELEDTFVPHLSLTFRFDCRVPRFGLL